MNSKLALLIVLSLTTVSRAQLEIERTIPLPGVKGRIDHMSIDPATSRLFVAALGNNTVEVVDYAAGKVVATIKDLDEPQGVRFMPESKTLAVASGSDGRCRIFDESLKEIAAVKDLDDADNVRYDAATHRVYVGFGKGALAIIEDGKKTGEIKLDAHPEAFQLETSGPRIFVNVPSAGHVAVVDRESRKTTAKWPIKEAAANFPMALDEADHRLLIACRKPTKLLAMDTESGKVVAIEDTAGDADDVWFDAKRNRVYVSGGAGVVSVHERKDADRWPRIANVPTRAGARTSYFDAESGKLFVAERASDSEAAAIAVFAAKP